MDTKVLIKIVRSDSKEFLINDGPYAEWKIPSKGLDGWGSFTNDISVVDNAVGDGGIVTSDRIGSCDRTFEAISRYKNLNDVLRRSVNSFFNAKYTYKVFLTYMGVTRWAEGKIEKYELSTWNVHKDMKLTVTFLFPNPYLRSDEDFGENIASVSGGIGFPFQCTRNKYHMVPVGVTGGYYNFAKEVVLENDGDVETFCKAVIVAKGEVTNPKLIIGDAFVRLIDVLNAGDTVVMDFDANPPTIRKNGVNVIGKCDRTSNFDAMVLGIGDTVIGYDADNGTNLLSVSIYYNKLYCAI